MGGSFTNSSIFVSPFVLFAQLTLVENPGNLHEVILLGSNCAPQKMSFAGENLLSVNWIQFELRALLFNSMVWL